MSIDVSLSLVDPMLSNFIYHNTSENWILRVENVTFRAVLLNFTWDIRLFFRTAHIIMCVGKVSSFKLMFSVERSGKVKQLFNVFNFSGFHPSSQREFLGFPPSLQTIAACQCPVSLRKKFQRLSTSQLRSQKKEEKCSANFVWAQADSMWGSRWLIKLIILHFSSSPSQTRPVRRLRKSPESLEIRLTSKEKKMRPHFNLI